MGNSICSWDLAPGFMLTPTIAFRLSVTLIDIATFGAKNCIVAWGKRVYDIIVC
jgi:hypothetical protein